MEDDHRVIVAGGHEISAKRVSVHKISVTFTDDIDVLSATDSDASHDCTAVIDLNTFSGVSQREMYPKVVPEEIDLKSNSSRNSDEAEIPKINNIPSIVLQSGSISVGARNTLQKNYFPKQNSDNTSISLSDSLNIEEYNANMAVPLLKKSNDLERAPLTSTTISNKAVYSVSKTTRV